MKISGSAIKRTLVVLAVVGLFYAYDESKRHVAQQPKKPIKLTYTSQDIAKQNQWKVNNYIKTMNSCLNSNQKEWEEDAYLAKYANLFQEQVAAVNKIYINASTEDKQITAENYFYTILNARINQYLNDYHKGIYNLESVGAIQKLLVENPNDPILIAALMQVGKPDGEQQEIHRIAKNTKSVENNQIVVENKYAKKPSIKLIKTLLLVQLENSEQSESVRNSCFSVLGNYPSMQ